MGRAKAAPVANSHSLQRLGAEPGQRPHFGSACRVQRVVSIPGLAMRRYRVQPSNHLQTGSGLSVPTGLEVTADG